MAGACAAAAALAFGRQAVEWTFGPANGPSVPLLGWLAADLVFILPNAVLTQACIAVNLERFYALSAGLSAVLNIGLNLILIPSYGALGAAWSTIATEAFLGTVLALGLAV